MHVRRAIAPAVILLAISSCTQTPIQRSLGDEGWGPSMDEQAPPRKKVVVPRALPIPVGQRKPWARGGEISALHEVTGRSRSEHLDGIFDRTVLVSMPPGTYPSLTPSMAIPAGTLVVQRHHPRGAERTEAFFVMEKLTAGASPSTHDWRFLVLDTELRVAAEKNLRLCGRCHADAPYNGLFGVSWDEAEDAP